QAGQSGETPTIDGELPVGTLVVKDGDTYTKVNVKSGYTKGSQEALEVLDTKKQELNDFAYSFATAVNTVHGKTFFDVSEENAAQSIKVADDIQKNPGLIEAGKDTDTDADGDGTRAQAIAQLQHTKLNADPDKWNYNDGTMSFAPDVSGATLSDKYNNKVTDMGIIKQQ